MNKSRKFAAFIFTTITLIAFSFHAQAQDDDEPHGYYLETPRVFYAGFLVGANFAQVDGDNFAGYNKIGLNAGGIAYAQLAKHVALSMEILYSQKGAKSTIVRTSNIDTTVYILHYGSDLQYAEIPVMINYFDKRKSHFGIGVSYAQLISSEETILTNYTNVNATLGSQHLDKYPFKKYDVNLLAGVQLHLVKGLFLNVRFQYSITPIRTQFDPAFARSKQFNNLWTVRLMYLFI